MPQDSTVPPLPNINPPNLTAPGSGMLQALSPVDFLAAYPRTNGSFSITVGGTITNNDQCQITFTGGLLGANSPLTVSAAVVTGDTTASIAQKIAKAINDNAILQSFGVFADSALAVVTVNWPGPLGAFMTATKAVTGSATETLTLSNGGVPIGGAGPIIPYGTFPFSFGGSIVNFYATHPVNVDNTQAAALAAAGAKVY